MHSLDFDCRGEACFLIPILSSEPSPCTIHEGDRKGRAYEEY